MGLGTIESDVPSRKCRHWALNSGLADEKPNYFVGRPTTERGATDLTGSV